MPIKRTLSAIKKPSSAHPQSRRAAQIHRAVHRNRQMSHNVVTTARLKQHPIIDKLTWFQLQIESHQKSFTLEEATDFVQRYVDRNMEEMCSLKVKRPIPPRYNLLKALREREVHELENGQFEMVELCDEKSISLFRQWNGDYNFLPLMKMRKYRK